MEKFELPDKIGFKLTEKRIKKKEILAPSEPPVMN